MDDEMIERCALAIYNDIKDDFAYVGNGDDLSSVTLDGDFNLKEFVRVVIKAMREPTEKMIDAAMWNGVTGQIVGEALTKECWQDMIDAVIND